MCKSAVESCYVLPRLFNWIVSSRFLFMSIDKRWLNVHFFFFFEGWIFIHFLVIQLHMFSNTQLVRRHKNIETEIICRWIFSAQSWNIGYLNKWFFLEFWKINFLYCGRKFCFVLNTFLFYSLWWFFLFFLNNNNW